MKKELDLAKQAGAHLVNLAEGALPVTFVNADRKVPLADDHVSWRIDVRTTGGYAFSFQMEGCNVAWVREVVEPDGRRLLHWSHAPLNPLAELNAVQQGSLDQVLLDAYCHVVGAQ